MYEHVRYDLLADADGEGTDINLEDKPKGIMDDEEQAFSFDSAFQYDTGVDDSKYRADTNYNSAFKYSENPDSRNTHQSPSVALNMSYEEKFVPDIEYRKTSYIMIITSWVLTFLSYVFFVITSPIT